MSGWICIAVCYSVMGWIASPKRFAGSQRRYGIAQQCRLAMTTLLNLQQCPIAHLIKEKSMHSFKFDKIFIKDLWRLIKPYWTSDDKWKAWSLLLLQLGCSIIGVRIGVSLNQLNKEFFDALQNFNQTVLFTSLIHIIALIAASLLIYGYSFYFHGVLSIRWRRWLTKYYLDKWLTHHRHYSLQFASHPIDNPDQRISEDLDKFSESTLLMFFTISEATMRLASFGYILWQLSGTIRIPIYYFSFSLPGYLFWGAILYASLGSFIINFIGKRLSTLDYLQQKFNADFRFALVRLRESSEQIALHAGETSENMKFKQLFKNIYSNFIDITTLKKRLMFFTSGYNSTSYFLGIFFAIPLYLQKKIQLGGVMQISSAFNVTINALSIFLNSFNTITEWRAVIYRLTEFEQSVNHSHAIQINIKSHNQQFIETHHLSLSLPDQTILLDNIHFKFNVGESYLLKGPSGIGKSTLLRALAGVWPYGSGEIIFPLGKKICFLPQKPYLPLGSLKEILLYPGNNVETHQNEDQLQNVLQLVGLHQLQNQLHLVKNWSKELSLGEQQLLVLARLFLRTPDIVFLDESTSALDESSETSIYQKIKSHMPKITLITVGHRLNLELLHDHIILLSNDHRPLYSILHLANY